LLSQVKDDGKETILGAKQLFWLMTFQPLIEDQVAVFESKYKADITVQGKSENELIQPFLMMSRIVVLSRMLSLTRGQIL
jgi:phosphate transport system substrate-binding protein